MFINCYNRRHNLSDFVTLKSFQRQNEDVYLQNIHVVRDFSCLKIIYEQISLESLKHWQILFSFFIENLKLFSGNN